MLKANTENTTNRVASLVKGITILEHVIESGEEKRLQDVAEHFSMDRSTAYRFLTTLEHLGLLRKNNTSKKYSAGPRFFVWQRSGSQYGWLFSIIKPEVERLATETGQTSHFAGLKGLEVELMEIAPSGHTIAVQQTAGDREPLYCSAVGKAILAFLPVRERHAMMDQFTFQRYTETTITNVPDLEKELESVKNSGIAFDNGEASPHVTCVAAPLLDCSGYPIGAIGLSAVKGLYSGTIFEQTDWVESVQSAVKKVSSIINNATQ